MKLYKPETLIVLAKPIQADGRDLLAITAVGGYASASPQSLLPERTLLTNFLLDDPLVTALDVGLPKLRGELLLYLEQHPGEVCTLRLQHQETPLPVAPDAQAPGCGMFPDWEAFLAQCKKSGLNIDDKPEAVLTCPEGFDYSFLNVAPRALQYDGFFQPGTELGIENFLSDTPLPAASVVGLVNTVGENGQQCSLASFHIESVWLFPQRDLHIVVWRSIIERKEKAPIQDLVLVIDDDLTPDLTSLYEDWSHKPGIPAFDQTENASLAALFSPSQGAPVSTIYLSHPLPDPFTNEAQEEDAIQSKFAKLSEDLGVNPKGGVHIPLPSVKPKVPVEKLIPMLRANGVNDPGLESELLRAAQGAAQNRQKAALLENQIKLMLGGS